VLTFDVKYTHLRIPTAALLQYSGIIYTHHENTIIDLGQALCLSIRAVYEVDGAMCWVIPCKKFPAPPCFAKLKNYVTTQGREIPT
jgi:hypothetical protein